jgi:hypothetical protein
MNTRVVFDREFLHAPCTRRLTISEFASRVHLSPATASTAVHGKPVNSRSAAQLARALASCHVIQELERSAAEEPLPPRNHPFRGCASGDATTPVTPQHG